MHALARVRLVIARFATVSMVLAVVATLGGTVVLLSYGLPAASGLRRGAAPAVVTPDLENAAASDRKSTRLNSSHSQISYAVFCLKKKKNKKQHKPTSPTLHTPT